MAFRSFTPPVWTSILLLCFFHSLSVLAAAVDVRGDSLERRYYHHEIDLDESKHDEEFFTFVTRPDLLPPRWTYEVYNQSQVSPGYWFTSPYSNVKQTKPGDAWIAPHIYDERGELIWSGAEMFGGYSTFDFRVVDILGKPMLSLIDFHNGDVVILDESYNVFKKIDIGNKKEKLVNMHEFATVENGTKALHLIRDDNFASKESSKAVGYNGECFVDFDGFKELDTQTWTPNFNWTSANHIGLNESYAHRNPVNQRCGNRRGVPWEFLHLNSVDKFPDGDYLVSGRRTFAIYKISQIDGSIVWRLGGKDSDFDSDIEFSGQHSARVLSQNETHSVIYFLDNAFFKKWIPATHKNSRGVILTLRTDTKPMRAETLMTFDHPEGGYAESRGNMELLSNGNAWICWSKGAMISEHNREDGSMIMKARLKPKMDSYRNFKFQWVGKPNHPPDVRSKAIMHNEKTQTLVHVSWNGATEVARWKIWHTDLQGELLEVAAESPRKGFETALRIEEYAGYIVAEALDKDGVSIGKSNVTQALLSHDQLDEAVAAEAKWQEEHPVSPFSSHDLLSIPFSTPLVAFLSGMIFSTALLSVVWAVSRVQFKRRAAWWREVEKSYEAVPGDEDKADDGYYSKDAHGT